MDYNLLIVNLDDAWYAGDDVVDDIGGAQGVGMRGILVKSGKYRDGDESAFGIVPDAVVENFSSAVNWILQCNKSFRNCK